MKKQQILWFIGLWCAGIAGAVLLTLPFKFIIHLMS